MVGVLLVLVALAFMQEADDRAAARTAAFWGVPGSGQVGGPGPLPVHRFGVTLPPPLEARHD